MSYKQFSYVLSNLAGKFFFSFESKTVPGFKQSAPSFPPFDLCIFFVFFSHLICRPY
jgi:hypothetical protein